MTNEIPQETREVSLRIIFLLLYGDSSLEDVPIVSKASGDTAKVLKLPYMLASDIKHWDKSESLFHVELIPGEQESKSNPPRGEIWIAAEWFESNKRLAITRERSAADRIFREKNNTRLSKIQAKLKSLGLDKHPGYVEHLSNEMLHALGNDNVSEALKVLGLMELFAEFQKEDEDDKQRSNTTSKDNQVHSENNGAATSSTSTVIPGQDEQGSSEHGS